MGPDSSRNVNNANNLIRSKSLKGSVNNESKKIQNSGKSKDNNQVEKKSARAISQELMEKNINYITQLQEK